MPESLLNNVKGISLQLYQKRDLGTEFCEISEDTFSCRTPPMAAYEFRQMHFQFS